MESGFIIGVGDEEVPEHDYIRTNDHIVVIVVVFHDFNVGHKVASRNLDMDKIGIRVAVSANAGY